MKCKVIGDRLVAGVGKNHTVDLDPGLVNVEALVTAGHIVIIPDKRATETAAQP